MVARLGDSRHELLPEHYTVSTAKAAPRPWAVTLGPQTPETSDLVCLYEFTYFGDFV